MPVIGLLGLNLPEPPRFRMMMKSGVVFFMCCFPCDVVAFLCAIAIVLCGFGNSTAARSVRLSEKLALGVHAILPSMALTVYPVFPGTH